MGSAGYWLPAIDSGCSLELALVAALELAVVGIVAVAVTATEVPLGEAPLGRVLVHGTRSLVQGLAQGDEYVLGREPLEATARLTPVEFVVIEAVDVPQRRLPAVAHGIQQGVRLAVLLVGGVPVDVGVLLVQLIGVERLLGVELVLLTEEDDEGIDLLPDGCDSFRLYHLPTFRLDGRLLAILFDLPLLLGLHGPQLAVERLQRLVDGAELDDLPVEPLAGLGPGQVVDVAEREEKRTPVGPAQLEVLPAELVIAQRDRAVGVVARQPHAQLDPDQLLAQLCAFVEQLLEVRAHDGPLLLEPPGLATGLPSATGTGDVGPAFVRLRPRLVVLTRGVFPVQLDDANRAPPLGGLVEPTIVHVTMGHLLAAVAAGGPGREPGKPCERTCAVAGDARLGGGVGVVEEVDLVGGLHGAS